MAGLERQRSQSFVNFEIDAEEDRFAPPPALHHGEKSAESQCALQ